MSDGPAREPLSGPDNAWLRMGERTNQMVITAVVVFEERVGFDDLHEKFERNLVPFDRFRQRIVGVDTLGRPRWEEDPEFALESHLQHVALPEPRDKQTFERFVAGVMATPLPPNMPLWKGYLVEGAGERDANALVMRIHHSIADGFALLYLLLGLADDPSELELPIGGLPDPPDVGEGAVEDGATGGDGVPAGGPAGTSETTAADGGQAVTGGGLSDLVSDVLDAPRRVKRTATTAGRAVSMAAQAPGSLVDLLTMDDEPQTSLVGELGVPKRVAWTEPVDLDLIRDLGEEFDGTINDVLMGATAGGFRRYLADRDEIDLADDLRVTVPVNLKPLDERTAALGNNFGIVYLQLPVGRETSDERMRVINERMDDLKGSPDAFLTYAMLLAGGNLPEPVQDLIARRFQEKATAIVTNVPGPTQPFTFAGEQVDDLFFWVPQSQGVGIGLSILSYDGAVRIGIASDANLVSDPQALADSLEAEVDALRAEIPRNAPTN